MRQFPQTLVFAPPMYSDATPGHYGYVRTDTARTTMYRNGTQVAQSDQVGYVLYEAPAEAPDFRVETTATQSVYDTVTETTAVWRFRSRPPVGGEDSALQPMAVRFLPQLDSQNRAPGGRPYLLPVAVERQPGAAHARVVSLTVDVSYDDGRSWRRVRLVKAGERVRLAAREDHRRGRQQRGADHHPRVRPAVVPDLCQDRCFGYRAAVWLQVCT